MFYLLRLWIALAALAVIALSGCESSPVIEPAAAEVQIDEPLSLAQAKALAAGELIRSDVNGGIRLDWYQGAQAGALNVLISLDGSEPAAAALLVIVSPDGSVASAKPCSYGLWKCLNMVFSYCSQSHPNLSDPDELEAYQDCIGAGVIGCHVSSWLFGWACDGNGHKH